MVNGFCTALRALVILSAVACTTALAAETSVEIPPNPPSCPAGYRCIPIPVYAQMTAIKVRLENRVAEFEARKRWFGWHAGCGFGAALIATAEFDLKGAPAGVCAVIYGW